MPKITFNGRTYKDLAEMPASERQAYEQLIAHFKDENQDGIPDIFQGDVVSNIIEAAASTTFVVNGKQVSGLGEMTQEQRIKLEKGMSMLQKLGIISDMPNLDGGIHAAHPTAMPVWDDAKRPEPEEIKEDLPDWLDSEIRASQPIIPQKSAIQNESGTSRTLLIILVLVSLLICGAGVFLYFLLG